MSQENHQDYCAGQVRTYDYDRYFAAAFAPPDVRRGLCALYAFNLEIATVRERVSEPLIGEMRLQWWRDTLDALYDGTLRDHAVVAELAWAIDRFDLARAGFDRMIDGRLFDIEEDLPEDIGALNNYASATAGELVAQAFAICGNRELQPDAIRLGTFWGLAGLLRSLPYNAQQRRLYLPRDKLRARGILPENIIEKGQVDGMDAVVGELVDTISAYGAVGSSYPKNVRPALAYVSVAAVYLRRLRNAGCNVFASGLEPSRLNRQIRMLRAAIGGRL